MVRSGTRSGQRRGGAARGGARARQGENGQGGLLPVLTRLAREVEADVDSGQLRSATATRFQVLAHLVREERTRLKTDTTIGERRRQDETRRLEALATRLATAAARQPSLFSLLSEDASLSDSGEVLLRDVLRRAGREVHEEEPATAPETPGDKLPVRRQVRPRSSVNRQLASPFLVPDFSQAVRPRRTHGRLANWELIEPLLKAFEYATPGQKACMALPDPSGVRGPIGLDLMKHQAELIAAARAGHRTFLLADEPGLGKTAQALLAANAAEAYPLLVVVPNVVKTNWAREVERWTPQRSVTVVHGDGDDIDGFADIVVINYELLDRHVGWLGDHGFGGMVVDEAHFIKNKKSLRSQHVLHLSERIRARPGRPLLMALTGTPLINDLEDFRAIWQFLGWIGDTGPGPSLMDCLEDTGLIPTDRGFFTSARQCVIDMGIVRRQKQDVAADIPARRIADLPVELDSAAGRSIREAERQLTDRLLARYQRALETRRQDGASAPVARHTDPFGVVEEAPRIDHELVRRVAGWELRDGDESGTGGENVFSMVRRIGQAKAELAADYTAMLARNVGKVVFFAKHIDVMDAAQALFADRGIGFSTIRGDQSRAAREKAIESFLTDPETQVIVCSLTAAGVGLNLQVASNVVLAELSWTNAEQTQAIDRVHRIGQDQPVTAWRVIASQTIDTRIAQLIDSKAGLAATALDGAELDEAAVVDVQLEALVTLLTDRLRDLGHEG